MNKKQKRIDAQLHQNPLIQVAAVECLAVDLKYTDGDSEEYAEEAAEVVTRCRSLMGLPPSDDPKLTPEQEAFNVTVMEAIRDMADKMGAALVKARLLRPDCAEARQAA